MVVLVTFLQASQNADSTQFIGLIYHHGLESALQGLILLKVFLILVQCGGTYGTQFATSQGWFQNVSGIHGTLATTCTYQGVDLVDKQDDAALGLGHLVDHTLQALLKLTFVLGTCYQCTHIQRVELLVLQVLGHIATHNTTSQSLNDGCFTCTRFTY